MKKIIVIFLPIIFTLILNSCKWISDGGTAFYSMTNIKIPDGTPTFKKGFSDGCKTSTYARGNPLYKSRYNYSFDPKMIGNTEYRFGYSRGYNFCFMHAIGNLNSPTGSADNYLNYWDPTMAAQDYNTTGDGFFDGGVFSWSANNAEGGLNGIFDVLQKGGSGTTKGAFDSNPFWSGGSMGTIFGQTYNGTYYGQ
jgi:hypothetical protein